MILEALKALGQAIIKNKDVRDYTIGAAATYGTWCFVTGVVKPKKGIICLQRKAIGEGPYDGRNDGFKLKEVKNNEDP